MLLGICQDVWEDFNNKIFQETHRRCFQKSRRIHNENFPGVQKGSLSKIGCRLRQATIENVGKMSQWSRQESVKIVGWIPPRIWSLICLATIPYLVTLYQLPRGFRFHRSSPSTYIQRRPSTKLSISTLCQAEFYFCILRSDIRSPLKSAVFDLYDIFSGKLQETTIDILQNPTRSSQEFHHLSGNLPRTTTKIHRTSRQAR